MTTVEKITVAVIALIITLSISLALLAPYFEAKLFNECTGGSATYQTALFTQLRIEDCKKD